MIHTDVRNIYHPYSETEMEHKTKEISSKKSADISFTSVAPDKFVSLADLPINFIWFGSVIPRKYLENIRCWASNYPNRLVVLWISSDLLTKEQCEKTETLKLGLPANIEILDVYGNPLLGSLEVKRVHDLIFKDLKSYDDRLKTRAFCLASDVYRVALMYHGVEAIKAAGSRKLEYIISQSGGVIYFDTDKYLDRLGCVNCCFKGLLFSNNMNDTFAVSENSHPFFYEYLMKIKSNFDELEMSGRPLSETLNLDFKFITMAGYMPMNRIVRSFFPNGKVEFPFQVMDNISSDCSWCDGSGLKLDEALC